MKKTLKTLVLKTVTASSVKLNAPATRIGLGFDLVAAYPADALSTGHIPVSRDPEPEQDSGSRQERPATQMQPQMRSVRATAETSGRSAGCLSFPGSSALRRPPSRTPPTVGWLQTKRTVTAGRNATSSGSNSRFSAFPLVSGVGLSGLPVVLGLQNRLGCDCQSPDRGDDQRTTSREARHATAAGK